MVDENYQQFAVDCPKWLVMCSGSASVGKEKVFKTFLDEQDVCLVLKGDALDALGVDSFCMLFSLIVYQRRMAATWYRFSIFSV